MCECVLIDDDDGDDEYSADVNILNAPIYMFEMPPSYVTIQIYALGSRGRFCLF